MDDLFKGYKLHKEDGEYTLILYLSQDYTEFASESFHNPKESRRFNNSVEGYVREKFPQIKIKAVKVMMGSMIVAAITLGGSQAYAAEITYKVASGDSLWSISRKFNVPVDQIKLANGLTGDTIYLNQTLKIPSTEQPTVSYTSYTVVSGDSLSVIAKRFGTTVDAIRSANNLTTDVIRIGQVLKIPTASAPAPTPAPAPAPATTTYKVSSGDSLWSISRQFNTTVDNIRALNNLATNTIYVGQVLTVPSTTAPAPTPVPAPAPAPTQPTVSYINHTVASGENGWNLSIRYGIPMSELLRANNLTESSVLSIGQVLRIPVHTIPVMQTPGPQYGEYLDWWTSAQYIFTINTTAKITDFKTGRSFNVKRTIGANHSDTEPLTAQDAAIMREIWGGNYSWTTRAVIVEVDGRRLAASMSSMPHGIEYIADNGFDGHFDIHFLNSTRHNDGTLDPYHQAQIKIAAGVQ